MPWRRGSTRLGDRAGAGSKVKIINQLLAGVHIAAAAEAMALGLREGVDPARCTRSSPTAPATAGCSRTAWPTCWRRTIRRLSAVDIFVKDLGLVLDMARASKFPAAVVGHRPPDVHAGIDRRSRGRGRQRRDQDISRYPAARSARMIRLGCIADDFTGATDLANNLVRAGMRTVQTFGVPEGAAAIDGMDAVVVALKSELRPPKRRWRNRCARWNGCARRARRRSTSSTAPPSTVPRAAISAPWPKP